MKWLCGAGKEVGWIELKIMFTNVCWGNMSETNCTVGKERGIHIIIVQGWAVVGWPHACSEPNLTELKSNVTLT